MGLSGHRRLSRAPAGSRSLKKAFGPEIYAEVQESLKNWWALGYFQRTDREMLFRERGVKQFIEAGAVMGMGTDSGTPMNFHSEALWREIKVHVDMGMTPTRAIAAATRVNAHAHRQGPRARLDRAGQDRRRHRREREPVVRHHGALARRDRRQGRRRAERRIARRRGAPAEQREVAEKGPSMKRLIAVAACLAVLAPADGSAQKTVKPVEMAVLRRRPGRHQICSTLDQINRDTVARLERAWEWKTGEQPFPQFGTTPGAFQNTPIMIDNVLYLSTPYSRVAALDAETGRELWSLRSESLRRGRAGKRPGLRPPRRRRVARRRLAADLRMNSRYHLICLDAKTGRPVESFGAGGSVDVGEGLVWPIQKKHYSNTSPPVVYKDLVILGSGIGDRLMYATIPPATCAPSARRPGR